jgi:hypothetical protein
VTAAADRLVDQIRAAGLRQPRRQPFAIAEHCATGGLLLAVQVERNALRVARRVVRADRSRQRRSTSRVESLLPGSAELTTVARHPNTPKCGDSRRSESPQRIRRRRVARLLMDISIEAWATLDDATSSLSGGGIAKVLLVSARGHNRVPVLGRAVSHRSGSNGVGPPERSRSTSGGVGVGPPNRRRFV